MDFSSVEEHTIDRRSLHRRINELERRDREIKDALRVCENEKFAWEHLCDISKNIFLLKKKYNVSYTIMTHTFITYKKAATRLLTIV